jgi:hypothetical protein
VAGQYFVQNPNTGRWYSKYGPANALVNAVPMAVERFIAGPLPRGGTKHRRLIFNLFFVLLAAAVAWVLYDITGLYGASQPVRVAFVLLVFYTTFFWYYLRCTNSESSQVLFFLLFCRELLLFSRGMKVRKIERRRLMAAWFWLLVLALVKISYLMLVPLTLAWLAYLAWEHLPKRQWAPLAVKGVLFPGAMMAAVQGFTNWARFGKPWLTGYHAWVPEGTGDLPLALYEMAFCPQWSLFLHFPLLIFAIFGARGFYKKHRDEAILFLGFFAAAVILIGRLPYWKGECSYGPRYFLFVMPLLSLPFLGLMERFWKASLSNAGVVVGEVVVLLLAFSFYAQLQVNRLDFFFKYNQQGSSPGMFRDPAVADYFLHRHMAYINWDHWRAREDLTKLSYYPTMIKQMTPAEWQTFVANTTGHLSRINYYWWQ